MEDFYGLNIDDATFDHQKNNFVSDIHDLFDELSDDPNPSCTHHVNNVQFHSLENGRMLLILRHPASLYFRGALSVNCLGGSVEVDGHIMMSGEGTALDVYSPCSHSALYLSTIDAELNVMEELENILKSIRAQHLLKVLLDETPISCLVLLFRNELDGLSDLSYEMKQALMPDRTFYKGIIYFPEAEECLNCVFDVQSGNRIREKLKYNELFRNATEDLLFHNAPRLAVCGEKGVGKSTALRYIANQLLSVSPSILFIDFDVGQPEFTVPGCVSIILVSIPLLGPSYTHVTTPLRSIFLGYVNADLCIDNYREAVKEIEYFCQETSDFSSIPWLINTMGYVKGCGRLLLNDIISRFKLTHCFQLNNTAGKNYKNNLPLVPQNIDVNFGSDYILKTFEMFHPSKTVSNITPRARRELMVAFYFNCQKLLLKLQTIKIKHHDDSSEEKSVLFESLLTKNNSLMRGEVVALCCPILESSHFMVPYLKRCIGFGLVVSCCDNELRILTPVHQNIFEELSYIVKGELELHPTFADDILSRNTSCGGFKSCIILTNGSDALCPSLFSFIP